MLRLSQYETLFFILFYLSFSWFLTFAFNLIAELCFESERPLLSCMSQESEENVAENQWGGCRRHRYRKRAGHCSWHCPTLYAHSNDIRKDGQKSRALRLREEPRD